MIHTAKRHNIFGQFLSWYFSDHPKLILRAWKNLLKFNLEYFSIPLLLKTFFYPWRRYAWSYGKFNFKRYFEAFISNSITRGLGAILRFFLILFGIFFEVLIFFGGLFVLIVWFFWPIIVIILLALGLIVLF